jgi:hypothetical protein
MAARLSALPSGRPFIPQNIPGTHFCKRLSRLQGHSAAGRIRSIEKIHLIGIRSRDLPTSSVVPQLATLRRAPLCKLLFNIIWAGDFVRNRNPMKLHSMSYSVFLYSKERITGFGFSAPGTWIYADCRQIWVAYEENSLVEWLPHSRAGDFCRL